VSCCATPSVRDPDTGGVALRSRPLLAREFGLARRTQGLMRCHAPCARAVDGHDAAPRQAEVPAAGPGGHGPAQARAREPNSLLALAEEEGRPVPAWRSPEVTWAFGSVEDEFREYLKCGVLAHGHFARLYRDRCRTSRLVAQSCGGRGFCPSCGGRRMSEVAAHLVDLVLPETPVRQFVLTLPFRLRFIHPGHAAYPPLAHLGVEVKPGSCCLPAKQEADSGHATQLGGGALPRRSRRRDSGDLRVAGGGCLGGFLHDLGCVLRWGSTG